MISVNYLNNIKIYIDYPNNISIYLLIYNRLWITLMVYEPGSSNLQNSPRSFVNTLCSLPRMYTEASCTATPSVLITIPFTPNSAQKTIIWNRTSTAFRSLHQTSLIKRHYHYNSTLSVYLSCVWCSQHHNTIRDVLGIDIKLRPRHWH